MKIFMILSFVLITFFGYAEDFKNYKMMLMHEFNVGRRNGEILTDLDAPSDRGPTAFVFKR